MKTHFVEAFCHCFLRRFSSLTSAVIILVISSCVSSCAYKLSSKVDTLPQNVRVIYTPLFKNVSTEPGLEAYFTNSLKREFLNSKAMRIVDKEDLSDAVLYGTVSTVEIVSEEGAIEAKDTKFLPKNTILSTTTKITVTVDLKLQRKNSSEVLWSSQFKQSRNYTPPQLTLPVINSANNLYNLSARRQTLETLSEEMMQLAFDRLVDNF
ncbi:MAG: LPS assembly lipoprotein LptE [Pseudobdellovibrio sp.]|nr:LPS assembly lipoprotein LptE [Pseudobdellovibrio sp.]